MIGSGISQGLVLLSNMFVARVLGIQEYGKLGIIQSTLALFAILSGTTFGLTPQKFIAELLENDKRRTERIISMSLVFVTGISVLLGSCLFLMASLISEFFFKDSSLTIPFKISASILFFNSLFGVQSGILAGFQKFKLLSYSNLFRGILSFPAMLVGGYIYGLNGVLIGTSISAFLTYFVTKRIISKVKKYYNLASVSFKDFFLERKLLLVYTLPSLIGAIVSMPVIWFSNTLLINSSNGYKEMGVFNMANTWRLLVLFVPTIINQPFMSMFASLYGTKDIANLNKSIKFNILLVFLITLIPFIIITINSKIIVKQYGVEFNNSELILIFLCSSAVFSSISAVLGNIFYITNKVWLGVCLNFIWSIIFILIFLTFEHKTALNLSYAYVISYLVHIVSSWFLTKNLFLKINQTI
jgi:O-antigen/teichoic acid export membrane protein